VFAAVTTYVKAIVAETANMAPAGYVKDETGYLKDAASEITGATTALWIKCSTMPTRPTRARG